MSATLSSVNLYETLIHLGQFICKNISWHVMHQSQMLL